MRVKRKHNSAVRVSRYVHILGPIEATVVPIALLELSSLCIIRDIDCYSFKVMVLVFSMANPIIS